MRISMDLAFSFKLAKYLGENWAFPTLESWLNKFKTSDFSTKMALHSSLKCLCLVFESKPWVVWLTDCFIVPNYSGAVQMSSWCSCHSFHQSWTFECQWLECRPVNVRKTRNIPCFVLSPASSTTVTNWKIILKSKTIFSEFYDIFLRKCVKIPLKQGLVHLRISPNEKVMISQI